MSLRGAALAALLLVSPAAALAQAVSLDGVEELARLGRAEEARAALAEWWGGPRGDASQRDLQRGLWLRGRLTVDPVQAALDYQRLAVLYPSGPYTAQALLRLAQAAYAQGDVEAARQQVEALARDYPTSPSRTQAEDWLRSAGPPPARAGDPPGGAPATVGAAGATGAPAGRPSQGGVTTVVPPDAAAGIRPSAARPPAPAEVPLDWSVQFGAFSDEERAFTLQRELVSENLAARLVRVAGSAFLHVRIGRFATREEAARQLEDVTRRGFTAAIVRDDRAEEVVRR